MTDDTYTTAEVASELGVTSRQVQRLAASLGVGRRLNPRMLVFSADDLAAMRERRASGAGASNSLAPSPKPSSTRTTDRWRSPLAALNHMIEADIARWMGWRPPHPESNPQWWIAPDGGRRSRPLRYTDSLDLLMPVFDALAGLGFTVAMSISRAEYSVTIFRGRVSVDRKAKTLPLACARAVHSLIDSGAV